MGQLVELSPSKKPSDGRDPWVIAQRKLESLLAVLSGEGFISLQPLLCVHDHRSEFQALEASAVSPDPLMPEKDRCSRAQPSGDRNDREQGYRSNQKDGGAEDVEEAFHWVDVEDNSEESEIGKLYTVEVFALLTKRYSDTTSGIIQMGA